MRTMWLVVVQENPQCNYIYEKNTINHEWHEEKGFLLHTTAYTIRQHTHCSNKRSQLENWYLQNFHSGIEIERSTTY